MMESTTEAQVNLLVECTLFVRKWLCWRKWLRVNGILEWGLTALQVYNDDGITEPVYRYEKSWRHYLSRVTPHPLSFNHFAAGREPQEVTGGQISQWMIREQQMAHLERQWCRINGEAILNHDQFKAVVNGGLSTTRDQIGNRTMVDFYYQICRRLAQLTQPGSLPCRASKKENDSLSCSLSETVVGSNWYLDHLFHTFDDQTLFLITEIMSHCLVATGDPPASPSLWFESNDPVWLPIPVKLSQQMQTITVNLETKAILIGQHSDILTYGRPINITLSTLRLLFNPHTIPQQIAAFNKKSNVRHDHYGRVLIQLIDSYHDRCPHVHSLLTCQTERSKLINMVGLKYIVRLLVTYSNIDHSEPISSAAEQNGDRFFLFPSNGIDDYSPIAEAMLLLSSNKPHGNIININHYRLHNSVIIEETTPIHHVLSAYLKKRSLINTSKHTSSCFSLWVTSLLFDRRWLTLAAKNIEPRIGIRFDTKKGFYLRHDQYHNLMMVLLPSNQVPQYIQQWQCDNDLDPLIGDNHADQEITSGFLRLVLVRREFHFDQPSTTPSINLDDPAILCNLFRDIIRYFDPRLIYIDYLIRIDPFLSVYVDSEDDKALKLAAVEQQPHAIKTIYSNIALWQLLASKITQKRLLVRTSPCCYGPELTNQGISQTHKGIIPLDIQTIADSWKLYIYDHPENKEQKTEPPRLRSINLVCTGDKISQCWLVIESKTLAAQALRSNPPIIGLINWYDDHYPMGKPTVKKIVSKRIYLINNLIAFCENPTKLIGGRRGKLLKVEKIYNYHFINYHPPSDRQHDNQHFIDLVYQPMRTHNVNYHKKKSRLVLSFYETPSCFVLSFQCVTLWFPKWKITDQHDHYQHIPSHLVPLMDWAVEQAMTHSV